MGTLLSLSHTDCGSNHQTPKKRNDHLRHLDLNPIGHACLMTPGLEVLVRVPEVAGLDAIRY